jgi:hypothetical protein
MICKSCGMETDDPYNHAIEHIEIETHATTHLGEPGREQWPLKFVEKEGSDGTETSPGGSPPGAP